MIDNIIMVRGDTKVLLRTLTSGDLPLDLVGASVTMTVEGLFTKTETDGINIALTGSGGEDGEITVTIDPADTQGVTDLRTAFAYNIQVTESDGTVTTPLRGQFIVLPDVTE